MKDKVVLFIAGLKNVNLSPNCGSTIQKSVLYKHQQMMRGYLCYENSVEKR